MSRPFAAAIGLALLLALPTAGHAQLGRLVKKAKEKVAPAAAAPSADESQPARLPGPELTADVVDHFLQGLRAEKDARDRGAAAEAARGRQTKEAQMDPQTRYYSCVSEKNQSDPKYPELQKLGQDGQDAAKKNDTNKAMQIATQMQSLVLEMQQRAETACASLKPGAAPAPAPAPTPDQLAIQNAPTGSAEDAGANGAGMTPLKYGQVKELIYTYLVDGKRAGVTDDEKQVIDAKRADLTDGFKAIGLM